MKLCQSCMAHSEESAATCFACGEASFAELPAALPYFDTPESLPVKRGPGRPRKQPPTPGQAYRDIIEAANTLLQQQKGI